MSIIIGWVFGNRMVKEEVACSGHVYRRKGSTIFALSTSFLL